MKSRFCYWLFRSRFQVVVTAGVTSVFQLACSSDSTGASNVSPSSSTTQTEATSSTATGAQTSSSTNTTGTSSSNGTSGASGTSGSPTTSGPTGTTGSSETVGPSGSDSGNSDSTASTSGTAESASTSEAGSTSGEATSVDITGDLGELTIEPNPNSVLSAYVSWTTAEPSGSLVQFGVDGLQWEIEDATEVTEHRVLVIGMRAETEYQIRAISGSAASTGTFTTGALPAQIPVAEVSQNDPARTQPGWTLMNVQKGDGTTSALAGAPPAAVIYDEEGQPVWYYINENGSGNERGGAISVDPTDKGLLMGPTNVTSPIEVDWAGNELWKCSSVTCGSGGGLSHHSSKLSNGDFVVMRDASSGGLISQRFEQFTPGSDAPVHTIGLLDAVTPGNASGDWAHGNSITVDLERDVAYMSFRWLGVIKMKYSTQEMIWHLPASYAGDLAQPTTYTPAANMMFAGPEGTVAQYTDIHDPELHHDADGLRLVIFDNGGFSGQVPVPDGNPGSMQTRALEYEIDEEALTATLVWEWPGNFDVDPFYTSDLYVPFWGDADELANTNVMITAGRRSASMSTPESRVIEVAKDDGQVVWELRLPRDHGVYRAERLFPLPLVRAIGE